MKKAIENTLTKSDYHRLIDCKLHTPMCVSTSRNSLFGVVPNQPDNKYSSFWGTRMLSHFEVFGTQFLIELSTTPANTICSAEWRPGRATMQLRQIMISQHPSEAYIRSGYKLRRITGFETCTTTVVNFLFYCTAQFNRESDTQDA